MRRADELGVLTPGDTISFLDRDDLLRKLDRLDVRVPARDAGRTKEHREHYSIVRYLRFLAGEDLLRFPVTLEKLVRDPPDFRLTWHGGDSESIEHTDGSTEEYQKSLTMAAREGERGFIWPLDVNTQERDAAALWSDALFSSFLKKSVGLINGRYSVDHLLIYDLTGVNLVLPIEEGAPLLRARIDEWLRCKAPAHRYSRVSILRDLALLLDLTGEARLLRARSPNFRLGVVRARDEEDLKQRLRAIDRYCREHSIRHLKLFGSVLGDREDSAESGSGVEGFRPDSDLDLLVEFTPGTRVTLLDMTRMQKELSELIGIEVDLRTAGDLSRYFRQKVVANAVELHVQRE